MKGRRQHIPVTVKNKGKKESVGSVISKFRNEIAIQSEMANKNEEAVSKLSAQDDTFTQSKAVGEGIKSIRFLPPFLELKCHMARFL